MKLLLIEDERQLSEVLATLLKQQKYAVDAVYDGISGEEYALSGIYDLIVLDIMLPKKSGLEVLRALRKEKIDTPILLLTAKSEIEDKILGLDLGADDYLTKPFATGELLARIRAMTRRKGEFVGDVIAYSDVVLDRSTHELCGGDTAKNKVQLALKEYQILELLLQNSKQIISKERFIEKIWGHDTDAEYNAIEVYVSFLRKKLAAIGSNIQIKAVRGVGYTLEDQL
ncbi:MAG: response regulator transcription factor [Clostridiales Family XIII bacterium]|jgi:DNA-binding response OmpR family regulator|nr:response regulator transcription factor [Clostridiales Family XIII bacterium]